MISIRTLITCAAVCLVNVNVLGVSCTLVTVDNSFGHDTEVHIAPKGDYSIGLLARKLPNNGRVQFYANPGQIVSIAFATGWVTTRPQIVCAKYYKALQLKPDSMVHQAGTWTVSSDSNMWCRVSTTSEATVPAPPAATQSIQSADQGDDDLYQEVESESDSDSDFGSSIRLDVNASVADMYSDKDQDIDDDVYTSR